MNACRLDPGWSPDDASLPVNRWILTEASQTAARVTAGIETYRFNEAADALYHFVWDTFCDWHLELIKPVLAGDDEAAKAETRACTAHVLETVVTLLHPFMPFLTEVLWGIAAGIGNRHRRTAACTGAGDMAGGRLCRR